MSLLPLAQEGLDTAGVERSDSEPLLSLMQQRVASGTTGARWQRKTLAALEETAGRDDALAALLERYLSLCAENAPVHEWPLGTAR